MPTAKKGETTIPTHKANFSWIIRLILSGLVVISFFPLAGTPLLSSGQTLIKLNPFHSGFDSTDPDSTFEHCIQNYLTGEEPLPFKWVSGKKTGPADCTYVVGYHFKLVWEYVDPHPRERTIGKKTEKEDWAGEYTWPPSESPAPYRFYVDYYLECTPPEFAVRATNPKINVGETSKIFIQVRCGREMMDDQEVKLSLSGPGRLESETLRTNALGRAETTYFGTACGFAEITAKYVNCERGPDKSEISLSIPIEVVGDCYYAKISGSLHTEHNADCQETRPGYSKVSREHETADISGSLFLTFEDDVRVTYNKYEDEFRWVLKVKDCTLSSFSYSEKGDEYRREEDASVPHLSQEVSYDRQASASNSKVSKDEPATVTVYFDGKTRKAKRAYIRGTIEYTRNYESHMKGKERRTTPGGNRIFDMKPSDVSRTTELSFNIVPVEDNVKGPSGNSRWQRDSEVTTGDGVTSFGGQGKKSLPDNSGCVKRVEEREYAWEMHMKNAAKGG